MKPNQKSRIFNLPNCGLLINADESADGMSDQQWVKIMFDFCYNEFFK